MNFFKSKTILSLMLIFSVTFSSFLFLPNRANAQITNILSNCFGGEVSGLFSIGAGSAVSEALNLVLVPVNSPALNVTTGKISGNTSWLNIKEGCLDSIAYMIAKIVLRQMTQSIITWINTGFQGDPLFITDPGKYFSDLANQQLNQVIWEIQRYPNALANQVVSVLTQRARNATGGYNLGQVIAQQCLKQEATSAETAYYQTNPQAICEQGGGTWNVTDYDAFCTGFTVTYLPGDATTRIAKAQEEKNALAVNQEKNNNGIFARAKNFFRDTFASVIIAVAAPAAPAGNTSSGTTPGSAPAAPASGGSAPAGGGSPSVTSPAAPTGDTAAPFNSGDIIDSGGAPPTTVTAPSMPPAITPSAPAGCTGGLVPSTDADGDTVCISPSAAQSTVDFASGATNIAYSPSTNCPTTPAQQEARAAACLNGQLSFSQCGGWGGWYAQTQNQQNNAMGAILAAQEKLAKQQAQKVAQEKSLVDSAGGFLSVKECIPGTARYSDPDVHSEDTYIGCTERIITPGTAVANSLKEVTNSSLRQAELVNSLGQAVDQILNAFFNQMLTMGVRSLTQNSPILGGAGATVLSGVGNSYLNQAQLSNSISSGVNSAEITAQRYYAIKRDTVSLIRGIVSSLDQLSSLGGVTGGNCPTTINRASSDISKGSQYSALADQYDNELRTLSEDLTTLQQIKNSNQGAGNTSNAYGQIAYRLPNESSVSSAEAEKAQTTTKKTSVDRLITDCRAEKTALDTAAGVTSPGGGSTGSVILGD